MIGKKMTEALNRQMNREFYNSRLYLSMAAHFHALNMQGATHWMEVQAQEETGHGKKIYTHLKDRAARVTVAELPAPPTEWDSPLAAFEAAYKHECGVSKEIDELLALAAAQKDNAAAVMLQWFVTEQVEEEASTDHVVQKLRAIKDAPGGLMIMDQVLGQRK